MDEDDALTPIDEEEDEEDEDSESIGQAGSGSALAADSHPPPTIVETAASPVSPQQVPLEIKQIESVL